MTPPDTTTLWQWDIYVKVFGGVVAGTMSLIGIPLALQQFRKTQAEIRKLRLEADALESKSPSDGTDTATQFIQIRDSPSAIVHIANDPRLRIPLLVLLDFMWAYIIISLLGHALNIFSLGGIGDILRCVVAAVLFIPIARETRKARRSFQPVSPPPPK